MDTPTRYKVLYAEVLLDRSLDFKVEPEPHQTQELDDLWDSLSEDEKKDLQIWLEAQHRI